MILLSTGRSEPEEALPAVLEHLQSDPTLQDVAMWYIQAVACLLKVVQHNQSVDILFLSGCQRTDNNDDGSDPDADPMDEFRVFTNREAVHRPVRASLRKDERACASGYDPARVLPVGDGPPSVRPARPWVRASDCILLTQMVMTALPPTPDGTHAVSDTEPSRGDHRLHAAVTVCPATMGEGPEPVRHQVRLSRRLGLPQRAVVNTMVNTTARCLGW